MIIFILVLLFAEFLVILGAVLAYRDNFFSVSQMQKRGITQGLPFSMHAGMWGDLLVISPMVAWIISSDFKVWSISEWTISIGLGFFVSSILHNLYEKIEIPESHVQGNRLTKAGWVHFLYVALMFTALILFYFFTPAISYVTFTIFSVLLTLHVIFANHILLEIMMPKWYGKHHFKDSLFVLSVVATVTLLAWRFYAIFL